MAVGEPHGREGSRTAGPEKCLVNFVYRWSLTLVDFSTRLL